MAKADVASRLSGSIRIWSQHGLLRSHRPTSHSSDTLGSIAPQFCRIQAHLEIYSQTHETQSLSKGHTQNILLTFLPQEPSFLPLQTLINCKEGVFMPPDVRMTFLLF